MPSGSHACQVCAVPLAYRERCESPACPCFGTMAGSDAMEAAALAWRSRHSVAAARTFGGRDALAALERRAWLDFQEAATAVEFVIEHS